MTSTVVAQQDYSSPGPTDWDGSTTTDEENTTLEGSDSLGGGDAATNESTDVEVRVTSKVAIDVKPERLDYPFVDVGEQELQTNRSYESVTIRNTGSEPIDRVWVNASTPQNDPFGGGSGSFDAGNFMQINYSQSTVSKYESQLPNPTVGRPTKYHYVNRKEFFFQDSDETPSFLRVSNDSDIELDGTTAASEIEPGALRVGGEEYYFALLENSDGCDGSGDPNPEIRIANTSSTADRTGTLDFTDDGPPQQPADYTVYDIEQTDSESNYGIVKDSDGSGVSIGGRTYDLLTKCETSSDVADNEEHVLRTRFNVNPGDVNDLAGEGSGGVTSFIFNGGTTEGSTILPNQFITLDTAVEVPRGVDQGQMDDGTFRVFVTSDNSALGNTN